MLFELIERLQHDLDLLGDCVHQETMVLPFGSSRGETEDAEGRRVTAPLRNWLRAERTMVQLARRGTGVVALAMILVGCDFSQRMNFFVTTSTDGHAMVGHSNKVGSFGGDRARSWNSAHLSDGCTVPALQKRGSGALLYCFAVD